MKLFKFPWAAYDKEVGRLVAQDRSIQSFLPEIRIGSNVMQSLKTVGAQPGCQAVSAAFVPMLPGMFFELPCDPVIKSAFFQ